MANDVKNYLHMWTVKNRLCPPVYSLQDGARPVKVPSHFICHEESEADGQANGARSNQPSGFHAEVRVQGLDYVGRGFQNSKKMAQTYAARNMVNHLCAVGKADPKELYRVPGCSDIADDFCKSAEEKAAEAAAAEEAASPRNRIMSRIKDLHSKFTKGEVVEGNRVVADPPAAATASSTTKAPAAAATASPESSSRAAPSIPKTPKETPSISPLDTMAALGKRNAAGETLNAQGRTAAEELVWARDEALRKAHHRPANDWTVTNPPPSQGPTSHGPAAKAAQPSSSQAPNGAPLAKVAEKATDPDAPPAKRRAMEGSGSWRAAALEEAADDGEEAEVVDLERMPSPEVVELSGEWSPSYSLSALVAKTRRRMAEAKARGLGELSAGLWAHYKTNRQDQPIFAYKVDIRTRLLAEFQRAFGGAFREVHLFITGSTVNGCGSYNSDMDLCLAVVNAQGRLDESKNFALNVLRRARNALFQNFRPFFDHRSLELIPAKVPILRLTIPGGRGGDFPDLELDININNMAGVRNSHLLHHYGRLDERFGALALALKHWAIKEDINSAQHGTLNSYSLILLLLHYLQTVPQPPVLPNLQAIHPTIFHPDSPVLSLQLFEDLPGPAWVGTNTDDVGTLLVGFFEFYADFPFDAAAISIRDAKAIPKHTAVHRKEKSFLMIEEPYDLQNTARCVHAADKMAQIVDALRRATDSLNRRPSLDAIDVTV